MPFHVKQRRCGWCRPLLYPQGVQACDVAFHVKRGCLWITSVDNFGVSEGPHTVMLVYVKDVA